MLGRKKENVWHNIINPPKNNENIFVLTKDNKILQGKAKDFAYGYLIAWSYEKEAKEGVKKISDIIKRLNAPKEELENELITKEGKQNGIRIFINQKERK